MIKELNTSNKPKQIEKNKKIKKIKDYLLVPENTQRCDNVVVRSQRRTTNTQHCTDIESTTSILGRCSNVA